MKSTVLRILPGGSSLCFLLILTLIRAEAQLPVTSGGSGGEIIRVTNLNARGPGSLDAALRVEGPRIVVFEVAGVIDLEGSTLEIASPYLTLAGQTAPSPGVTLIKGGIKIRTHDVIIQHLKVRPGEAGHAKKSGWEVDGISSTSAAHHVIVDHCSLSWATDENLSASGPRFGGANVEEWRQSTSHEMVFSNCIIAEGLSNSTHAKGEHSKGSLIHDNTTGIVLTGNLFASNMARSPFCKGGSQVTILNNYIYNPGKAAIHYSLKKREWIGHAPVTGMMVVAGNVIEYGPDSHKKLSAGSFHGPVEVYWTDNLVDAPASANTFSGKFTALDLPPFWPEGYELLPSARVKESVLENAGAFPWDRDAIDQRIIDGVLSGTGRIIDSEKEVGGYPEYEAVYRKLDDALIDTLVETH